MKNNDNGFSLIEIMVALAIAAPLTLILYQSFEQMNRTAQSIETMADVHTRAALAMAQFERDISGAFVPPNMQDTRTTEQNPPAASDKKQLTHLFHSENKDNNLLVLTFITNNPLAVYWSSTAGSAKPRIARVVYHLKPQPAQRGWRQPSYLLTRQESYQLDYELFKPDAEKKIKEYELIAGIKQLTCTFYTAPESASANPSGQTKATADRPIEYKKVTEWNKDQKALIPHEVEISLTLWGNQQRSERTFTFTIPIYPDVQYLSKKEERASSQLAKPQTVPGAASMPPAQPVPTQLPPPSELVIELVSTTSSDPSILFATQKTQDERGLAQEQLS